MNPYRQYTKPPPEPKWDGHKLTERIDLSELCEELNKTALYVVIWYFAIRIVYTFSMLAKWEKR